MMARDPWRRGACRARLHLRAVSPGLTSCRACSSPTTCTSRRNWRA